MDLKKDEPKKEAVILDFRRAYTLKHTGTVNVISLEQRIKNLKHSERGMKRLMEDIYNGHDSND